KKFWYKLPYWDKKLATLAIESGFEAIYVDVENIDKIKELSRVKIIAKNAKADLEVGKNVAEVFLKNKESEDEAIKYQGKIPIIVKNREWTIIPLENLISKTSNIIQYVKNCKEAKLALETMEVGADGILLETDDLNEIKKVGGLIKETQNEKLKLVKAEITNIKALGIGDRVVVDTSSILNPGQGMLIGDSASAMFLVYNENVENPYCDPRAFRVNAGGAHAYIRMPNDKTKYLAELKSGDKALIIDPQGNTEQAIIGRAKIEKRPMLIIKAKFENRNISLIMQNAETIRLTKKDGSYISVAKLKKGDKILAFLQESGIGRHFGQKIKETILEK
ncbi:3-dehydroquinate synthase II, partial [Candidatus Parcubacteria bacterium]|nr:3-dehydroquinate synthase II [Candidatus Parcubacteria bacterium]